MALLTTQKMVQSGLVPYMSAANSGGDSWEPASTTFLLVVNGSGGSVTVNIPTTATAFGQPIADIAVVVGAGATCLLGPYDPGEVAQPSNGQGSITYSSATSVTVAAIGL